MRCAGHLRFPGVGLPPDGGAGRPRRDLSSAKLTCSGTLAIDEDQRELQFLLQSFTPVTAGGSPFGRTKTASGEQFKWLHMDDQYPLSLIEHDRTSLYEICDDMERIADQLGGAIDIELCTSVLSRLRLDLQQNQQDEEVLFSLLRESQPDDALLARCIGLAVSEHVAIASYALEVAEPIGELCAGSKTNNADATGYLLRSSFDYIRQHLRWEDAIFFLGKRYAAETVDRDALQAGLLRIRSHHEQHLRVADQPDGSSS